jgi:tetratricopeptide (TPR) repeat protein
LKKLTSALLLLSLSVGVSLTVYVPCHARVKAANTEDPMIKNHDIGMECIKKGDWDGAVDAFLQSVYFARNNYAPDSYHYLAVSYMAKKQDLKAIEAAKKAIEQSTGAAFRTHILLAEIYLRNNRLDEAEQECSEAMSADSRTEENLRGHYLYGRVFEAKGSPWQAQLQYEYALGDKPWTFTDAWMAYAELMMKQKNWVSAIAQFNDMIKSEKVLKGMDYPHLYYDLGICLLAKGDHQGAMTDWHKGLSLNMAEADIHLQLAMMFDAERHISSAIKEYKEFTRYSTDQIKVAKAKQRLEMLEQMVAPAEAPYQVKMSPLMRKQQEMENNGGEAASTKTDPAINDKDPGF